MTGRRLKLIAAQAVVVGGLMIVVSLTLLRSEDGNPLFDIVAPGGAEISVGPARSGPAAGDSDDPRASDAAAEPPPGDSATPPLGLVPAPGPPADPRAPGYEDNGPSGDQYADTLARLTQQLR